MSRKLINLFFIILAINLVLPSISFAQSINISETLTNELGVELIPNYPKANELVSLVLSFYTGDLKSAQISWYLNGKLVADGIGKTAYSFMAGNPGETAQIEVKVRLSTGVSFSKSFTLTPASVDILWEANSYVPPFYKGKALHPKQGILKLVAVPEFVIGGVKTPAENLLYEWSNNGNVYTTASGMGKNFIFISGSVLGRNENISVTVKDPITGVAADSFINIPTTDPEIIFYENHPFYGQVFDYAIPNMISLNRDEVEILAAPFYFTKENSSLQFQWKLNGQKIESLSGSRTAIFRRPSGQAGKSVVSLQTEVSNRILQQADKSMSIQFYE